MDKPTDAQVREFWEWCGFDKWTWWKYPNGQHRRTLPPIDLNNLFKYAVLKFKFEYGGERLYKLLEHWSVVLSLSSGAVPNESELALALFWAIWEVIHDG